MTLRPLILMRLTMLTRAMAPSEYHEFGRTANKTARRANSLKTKTPARSWHSSN